MVTRSFSRSDLSPGTEIPGVVCVVYPADPSETRAEGSLEYQCTASQPIKNLSAVHAR